MRPSLKRRRLWLRVCAEKAGDRAEDKARGAVRYRGRQRGWIFRPRWSGLPTCWLDNGCPPGQPSDRTAPKPIRYRVDADWRRHRL